MSKKHILIRTVAIVAVLIFVYEIHPTREQPGGRLLWVVPIFAMATAIFVIFQDYLFRIASDTQEGGYINTTSDVKANMFCIACTASLLILVSVHRIFF